MSTAIDIQKRCICLRNGNEIWVSEETYQKLSRGKEGATGNMLIYISELDRELNTADIVEICTPEQMEDKRRIDRGEVKCVYGEWHSKRERCGCLKTKMQSFREKKKEQEEIENNRPPTKAEIARRRKMMAEVGKKLKGNRIVKTMSPVDTKKKNPINKNIKAEHIKHSKDGNCVVCGNKLDPNLASVCGGSCKGERDKNPEKYKDKLI